MTATLLSSTNFLAASTSSRVTAGGPVFFSTQATMVSAVRPPVYSTALPLLEQKALNSQWSSKLQMVNNFWPNKFSISNNEFLRTVFYQVQCTLFYIENDAVIFPAHYTWKVAEKGFKMAFMMKKDAMINSYKIILEK